MLTTRSVVVGTIGSDVHMIGAWVLTKYLESIGFKVKFLGAVVPQEEFIAAAIETKADAILVSSMYGMGVIDCEGLRDKCDAAGLKNIVLYVGGSVVAPRELEDQLGRSPKAFYRNGLQQGVPQHRHARGGRQGAEAGPGN